MTRRVLRALLAASPGAALAPAHAALAGPAFGPATDVAVPFDAIAMSILGPGQAVDPATGAVVPVQRVALLGDAPHPEVAVVSLDRSGHALGTPAVTALPAGSRPRATTAADLDGDGTPEAIVVGVQTDTVIVSVVQVPTPDAPPLPHSRSARGPRTRAQGKDRAVSRSPTSSATDTSTSPRSTTTAWRRCPGTGRAASDRRRWWWHRRACRPRGCTSMDTWPPPT